MDCEVGITSGSLNSTKSSPSANVTFRPREEGDAAENAAPAAAAAAENDGLDGSVPISAGNGGKRKLSGDRDALTAGDSNPLNDRLGCVFDALRSRCKS